MTARSYSLPKHESVIFHCVKNLTKACEPKLQPLLPVKRRSSAAKTPSTAFVWPVAVEQCVKHVVIFTDD